VGPTSVDVALVFSALCRIKVMGMDPRIDRYGRRTRSTTSSIFRNMADLILVRKADKASGRGRNWAHGTRPTARRGAAIDGLR
jgi:hypothetical protein